MVELKPESPVLMLRFFGGVFTSPGIYAWVGWRIILFSARFSGLAADLQAFFPGVLHWWLKPSGKPPEGGYPGVSDRFSPA